MKTVYEIPDQEAEPNAPGIAAGDVVRMLFKHKWKLIFLTLLGFGAAAAVYLTHVPQYVSTSKIFVRYVEEVSNVDAIEQVGGQAPSTESVIQAELEILQSWDLAAEVVAQMTPAAILPNVPNPSESAATYAFKDGLDVDVPKGSRVIAVSYQHPDPTVAVRALTTLVTLYRDKHVEIHRATKSRETSRGRRAELMARISQLSERIEELKSDNGISSLPDAAEGLNKRAVEIRAEFEKAQDDLQEQKARVAALKELGLVPEVVKTSSSNEAAPDEKKQGSDFQAHLKYQGLMKQLTSLQEEDNRLQRSYSAESDPIKDIRKQIASVEAQRAALETENPKLLSVGPAITAGAPLPAALDPMVEAVRLATLTARVDLMAKRQEGLKEEFKQFSIISRRISDLERDLALQNDGLKQFAGAFQRSEFEQPLRSDDYDNISVVQTSSPPVLALGSLFKRVGAIGMSGLGLGLILVAILELVLNRTMKAPLELETRAGIPLMLAIPKVTGRQRAALTNGKRKSNGELVVSGVEAWAGGHFIRPYAEALRDRLVLHFEQIGLTRKPKLVCVSSYTRGEGVTTVAGGIAAALSEVGDGKVLLVDMNPSRAEVHPFFEGKPAATLADALEGGTKIESAANNLYLATAAENGSGGGQLFPKRFYNLIPEFQASDFDYIIFDMPPLDESSITLAMAGYMDKTLLVVEAEKGSREIIKRACAELLRAGAKLAGVFNKAREYGPKWLQMA